MIKYFSEGQKPVVEFDEWVGVLNLATKWAFREVLSLLFTEVFLCSALISLLLDPRKIHYPTFTDILFLD
jgi:hypothetical protein